MRWRVVGWVDHVQSQWSQYSEVKGYLLTQWIERRRAEQQLLGVVDDDSGIIISARR